VSVSFLTATKSFQDYQTSPTFFAQAQVRNPKQPNQCQQALDAYERYTTDPHTHEANEVGQGGALRNDSYRLTGEASYLFLGLDQIPSSTPTAIAQQILNNVNSALRPLNAEKKLLDDIMKHCGNGGGGAVSAEDFAYYQKRLQNITKTIEGLNQINRDPQKLVKFLQDTKRLAQPGALGQQAGEAATQQILTGAANTFQGFWGIVGKAYGWSNERLQPILRGLKLELPQ
jgi:hypothetical protein